MIKRYLVGTVLLLVLFAGTVLAAQQANVFVYHRFGDDRYPSTNIDIEVFANQLEYLHQNNYTVLYVSDIVNRLKKGISLPDRCAALTVDDGYSTFLTGAMPLLRQYGFPVTLFVSSGSVGSGSYLNWHQLRQLQNEGVEIGNHSASHPYFVGNEVNDPDGWRQKASQDIGSAQKAFKKYLNYIPTAFAYPYGEYSSAMEELLEELGFDAAFAQQSGVISSELSSYYSLPRFPMGGAYATLSGFKSKLAMKPLPIKLFSTSDPVLADQDPPLMVFSLDTTDINVDSLCCYVQGQKMVKAVALGADKFSVRAEKSLAGRRNKYTLTAQSCDGKSWYWFSHLWIHP